MLLQLIQLKDKHNIIPFTQKITILEDKPKHIKEVFQSLSDTSKGEQSNTNIISDDLLKLLEHMLKGDEQNKEDLLNYILPSNKQMKKDILDFLIQNNNSLKKIERTNIKSFIDELIVWEDIVQAIQFLKNQM